MAERVYAECALAQRADRMRLRHGQLRIDVLQVPFERFALQALAQLHAVVDAVDFGMRMICLNRSHKTVPS